MGQILNTCYFPIGCSEFTVQKRTVWSEVRLMCLGEVSMLIYSMVIQ